MSNLPNLGSPEGRESAVAAIMACTRKAPFLGRTLDGLKLQFDPAAPFVAATNGQVLRVNPDRLAGYEPAEQVGIMAHEAMHVICGHSRRLIPANGFPDHEKANRAADYAINGWLLGKGFEMPEDGLYNPDYDGMGAQAIYPWLPDNPQEQAPAWGGFDPNQKPEPGDDKIPEGARAAGLEELLCTEFGITPKPHRLSLERILSRLLITDPVWQRDYRRPSRSDDNLPSWLERDEQPRNTVALDVSGSIDRRVRAQFLDVSSRVTIPFDAIAVDDKVRGVWRGVHRHNCAKMQAEFPRTGGGTAFQPGIDYAASNHSNLVYLTDGENFDRLARKGVPITWLIWGDRPINKQLAQIGKVIRVEP